MLNAQGAMQRVATPGMRKYLFGNDVAASCSARQPPPFFAIRRRGRLSLFNQLKAILFRHGRA